MKMYLLGLVIAIGIGSSLGGAQVLDEYTTSTGQFNGVYWCALTLPEKVNFILGYSDAFNQEKPRASLERDDLNPMPKGQIGEIIALTDHFFLESPYRVMPIVAAWRIARYRQAGHSQSEVNRMMARYRELYIQAPRSICQTGASKELSSARCKVLGVTLAQTSR